MQEYLNNPIAGQRMSKEVERYFKKILDNMPYSAYNRLNK